MTAAVAPEDFALLLGLSFFFGLAFEEFHARDPESRPGGVRTFPLLAFAGAGLYLVAPEHGIAFAAGILILGAWLTVYYRQRIATRDAGVTPDAGLMVPTCNLLAFLLGPITLMQPPWIAIGVTVVAVLLLGARERLHAMARRIPEGETATAGKFLILTGIILPLVPNTPVTSLTVITPYQLWLAVVAVSTLSYGSYLVQRYVWPRQGIWVASVLGGLYSSTATTVMLARRIAADQRDAGTLQAGVMLATALMYLRIEIVVAVFNLRLAAALVLPLAGLCLLALVAAFVCQRTRRDAGPSAEQAPPPGNPLELSAAAIFAVAFLVVSLAGAWGRARFGDAGIYWLAAIVGVSDVDPFVLSLAQGSPVPMPVGAAAVVIASSSNNLLKAGYCLAFAGARRSVAPALALLALSLAGGVVAWLLAAGYIGLIVATSH
jgi:uncharacterized membrane protein (DUF4010 family)